MYFKLISTAFFILASSHLFAQLNLHGELKAGTYPVGIKQVEFETQDNDARTLNIFLWYPAEDTEGEQLTFEDYFNYQNQSTEAELLQDLSKSLAGASDQFPDDSLSSVLKAPMLGRKGVKAAEGQFPLLVWSARYGTVEYQTILSEFLASHGYIVVYIEDIPNSPFPWQVPNAAEKEQLLKNHIDDIGFGVALLKSSEIITFTKVGVLAWSYAGESAIFSQISNSDIDLVIGLSGIGFTYGLYTGSELPNKVAVEDLNVPYLILSERVGTNGKVREAPSFFDEMHPNSRYVSFQQLAHGSFNGLEGMIPGIMRTNKVQSWSKGGALAQTGYEAICRAVLYFLNSNFSSDNMSSFEAEMQALSETLPNDFFSIEEPSK